MNSNQAGVAAGMQMGVSLGSLASDASAEVVLTRYASIPVETDGRHNQKLAAAGEKTRVSPSQLAEGDVKLQLERPADEIAGMAMGKNPKRDPLSGNKLWTISAPARFGDGQFEPQLNDDDDDDDDDDHRINTITANVTSQRKPFQIVWTDLSFQVDLSTYDKLINGLLRATQTLGQLVGRGPGQLLSERHFGDPEAANLAKMDSSELNSSATKLAEAGAHQMSTTNSLVSLSHSSSSGSISQTSPTSGASSSSSPTSTSDKRIIFEHLNGYVNSGEITAILGPSGAGKTSLLNALCGRQENYGGRIKLVGGVEKQRMRWSIIPQKDYLIENLTVRENLLYSSRILNPRRHFDHEANIMRVVKMLNLINCFNSIASTISGGEYKRVSIAQELLRQPDILILDEPTSGLDSLNCKNLIRSLAALIEASRRGQIQPIAIVMTIHQPDVDIFHMFDHVYCLARGGRVIFDGQPRDAMRHLRSHAGLASLTGGNSAPNTAQDSANLDLVPPLASESNNNNNISTTTSNAAAAADPYAATVNPANLLIEIASEDIYGQEPIERLARFYRKQFEQLAAPTATSNSPSEPAMNQLQLNLITSMKQQQQSVGVTAKLARPADISCAISSEHKCKRPPEVVLMPTSISSNSLELPSPTNGDSRGGGGPQAAASGEHHSSGDSTSTTTTTTSATTATAATGRPKRRAANRQLMRDKRLTMKSNHSGRFWYHTNVLASRAFVSTLRDPLMTMISFVFHLSIPFVMWTVYPRRIGTTHACPVIQRELDMVSMASNRTAARLEDLQEQLVTTFESSTMFFLTTYSFSMCSLTVASLAFPLNMHILLKEIRNGWYSLPSYVVAKTLANFPFEVLFPVVSLVMIYLMLGMPSSPYEWRLAAIALVMALVSMISHTQGLIFGALCMDSVQTAIFLASASSLPQTLLSGFTARIRWMPMVLQRVSWLSQYRYSSDLINMIRFGFGICPCDASTDAYLRNTKPDYGDVPSHLKPLFTYYLTNGNANEDQTNTATAATSNETTATATTTVASVIASNVSELVGTTVRSLLINETASGPVRIPGVEYDLMLNETERADMLRRMELGELDLFTRMADMTGRAFSFGRPLDQGCRSIRSQLLVTAGTPTDDNMPLMFGAMFGLLIVCKLILFLVVRKQIGSRV